MVDHVVMGSNCIVRDGFTMVPAIGFFGGVHGLERIGTQVLLHFLE